jgi:hypothetical protein
VVDTALGAAMGYGDPRYIRRLIQRHQERLRECGLARHRDAPIVSGKAG